MDKINLFFVGTEWFSNANVIKKESVLTEGDLIGTSKIKILIKNFDFFLDLCLQGNHKT